MNDDFLKQISATHELDQAFAALRQMAAMARAYYQELTDTGFTKSQAMEMVRSFQAEVMRNSNGGTPNKE